MTVFNAELMPQGGVPTFVAASGADFIVPIGGQAGGWSTGMAVIVKNTDVATRTVTVEGLPGVIVPATTGVAIIPVPFKGVVPVTILYSATAGVSVAVVKLV